MKKFIGIFVIWIGVLLISGCSQFPQEGRSAIYATQSTLKITVNEAKAAEVAPWATPMNESGEERNIRLQKQVDQLLEVMEASSGTLKSVVEYLDANRNTVIGN